MDPNQLPDPRLLAHFSGQARPEDEAWAQQFKEEQPEEYAAFLRIWEMSGRITPMPAVDTAAEWNRFKGIFKKEQTFPSWLRIAASVAILLGLGWWGMNQLMPTTHFEAPAYAHLDVTLDDGTFIQLAPGASLDVLDGFNQSNRPVHLHGKAYFKVAKDPSKPFQITGVHTTTTVLGTAFDLETTNQSEWVYLEEGKVSFAANGSEVILQPGEGADFNGRTVALRGSGPFANGWRTGSFQFDQTPVKTILEELAAYYEFRLDVRVDLKASCTLTTTYNRESFANVQKELQQVLGLKSEVKDKVWIITSINCK